MTHTEREVITTLCDMLAEAHESDRTNTVNGRSHGGDGRLGCTYCEAIRAGRAAVKASRLCEARTAQTGDTPMTESTLTRNQKKRFGPGETYDFAPHYTFGGYASKWHECPFDTEQEALDFLQALQTCDPQFIRVADSWGTGKERELDKARHAAAWPEATDEELTAPGLEDRLRARLPKLLEDFRAAVESLGMVW